MFCPLCGKRLANPSGLDRPDGEKSYWVGLIVPSCSCGATLQIEATCENHSTRFEIKGFGQEFAPVRFVNCIASHVGHWPEYGLNVEKKTP